MAINIATTMAEQINNQATMMSISMLSVKLKTRLEVIKDLEGLVDKETLSNLKVHYKDDFIRGVDVSLKGVEQGKIRGV